MRQQQLKKVFSEIRISCLTDTNVWSISSRNFIPTVLHKHHSGKCFIISQVTYFCFIVQSHIVVHL